MQSLLNGKVMKKFYFSDTGILNLFLFNPESLLLETLVYNVLRRIYGTGVYYYRENTEVDFYIPDKALLQKLFLIVYMNSNALQREMNSLVSKQQKKLKHRSFQIITYNDEDSLNYKGYDIEIVPAWKWLMSN